MNAEEWAEWVTEGVWDVPAIETRDEFKAALVRAFEGLARTDPELLTVLREMVNRYESADDEPAFVARARAAIAKAERLSGDQGGE
jgi:hypothetical protein